MLKPIIRITKTRLHLLKRNTYKRIFLSKKGYLCVVGRDLDQFKYLIWAPVQTGQSLAVWILCVLVLLSQPIWNFTFFTSKSSAELSPSLKLWKISDCVYLFFSSSANICQILWWVRLLLGVVGKRRINTALFIQYKNLSSVHLMKVKSQEMYKTFREESNYLSQGARVVEVFMKQHFWKYWRMVKISSDRSDLLGEGKSGRHSNKENTIKGCKEKKHGLCSENQQKVRWLNWLENRFHGRT